MDALEFLAQSEWPAVAVWAIWLIRKPLVEMLQGIVLTKFEAWGLKAEFEKGLDKVDILVPPVAGRLAATQQPNRLEATGKVESKLIFSASPFSPEVRVLQKWNELDSELRRMTGRKPLQAKEPSRASEQLSREWGLGPDEVAALKELYALRNKVAHNVSGSLTKEEANRYGQIADRILKQVEERTRGTDNSSNPDA